MRFVRPMLVTVMLVAASCSEQETVAPAPAPAVVQAPSDANPRAAPGLVRWHESVAAAQTAAAASGKPVLVFQLLGSLKDEFC